MNTLKLNNINGYKVFCFYFDAFTFSLINATWVKDWNPGKKSAVKYNHILGLPFFLLLGKMQLVTCLDVYYLTCTYIFTFLPEICVCIA